MKEFLIYTESKSLYLITVHGDMLRKSTMNITTVKGGVSAKNTPISSFGSGMSDIGKFLKNDKYEIPTNALLSAKGKRALWTNGERLEYTSTIVSIFEVSSFKKVA
jgi:hypothetical protein